MVLEDFLKVMEDMETSKIFNLNAARVGLEMQNACTFAVFQDWSFLLPLSTSHNYLISKCLNMYHIKINNLTVEVFNLLYIVDL